MNLRRRGHVVLLLLAGFGLLVAVLASAEPTRVLRPSLVPGTYFPLQPGSHWVYERSDFPYTWEVSVPPLEVGTPPPLYQPLVGYFWGDRQVRVDAGGNVREWSGVGDDELLWYQLDAPVGTSWILQLTGPDYSCVSNARLVVAERGVSLTVAAGTFHNVVRIAWGFCAMDGGIGSEWFAPGVGLIRRSEMTIIGPVTSDLVRFDLGGNDLPQATYATTIGLETARYYNYLTPRPGVDPLPTMRGYLRMRNSKERTLGLEFGGCKSVAVEVRDRTGTVVAAGRGDDGGCCSCGSVLHVNLGGVIAVPFAVLLAGPDATPLPDGEYSVSVTLETLGDASLRPTARALIEIHSFP
jgi:hypothetical protein